jgi:hypothetical protein
MRTYSELWPRLGPQQYHTIALTLVGLAATAVAWTLKVNTNLLYVVYLLCSYVAIQIVLTRLSLRLGLLVFFLFFLFYSPKPIPPLPEEIKLGGAQSIPRMLPAGATRSYSFMLAPLRSRKAECGSLERGDIYLHFKPADSTEPSPVVSIDHGTISGQDQTPFYAGYIILRDHAQFAGELPDELRVSVRNQGRKPFEIYQGPEIAQGRVYPEAVFMKFESPECSIVAHSSPVD